MNLTETPFFRLGVLRQKNVFLSIQLMRSKLYFFVEKQNTDVI